jgi:hypothetical protein
MLPPQTKMQEDHGHKNKSFKRYRVSMWLVIVIAIAATSTPNSIQSSYDVWGLRYNNVSESYYVDPDYYYWCNETTPDCEKHICEIANSPGIAFAGINPINQSEKNCLFNNTSNNINILPYISIILVFLFILMNAWRKMDDLNKQLIFLVAKMPLMFYLLYGSIMDEVPNFWCYFLALLCESYI